MDEGADRSRTFHGVGQPDVQREHGTLTGTTDKHQAESPGNHAAGSDEQLLFRFEGERAGIVTVDEDTDEEAQVGKTGHDECLLAGCDGFRLGVVEADEQVGRYTHQLPEHIHLEDVRGNDESQHRE